MTDAELLVTAGEQSEAGTDLIAGLPVWMPTDEDTGNFKLLDTVGRAVDRLEGEIENVDDANTVQTAENLSQLEQLAELVQLDPKTGESLKKYRARTIAEFQTNTSEGTASDVVNNAATILDVDNERVTYVPENQHGLVSIEIPSGSLDEIELSDQEFIDIMDRNIAASFRIEITARGTFTYISVQDYNDGAHDPSKGYDGLDSNDDPKGNGGTYAGLIS
jgi:hypothetical protein